MPGGVAPTSRCRLLPRGGRTPPSLYGRRMSPQLPASPGFPAPWAGGDGTYAPWLPLPCPSRSAPGRGSRGSPALVAPWQLAEDLSDGLRSRGSSVEEALPASRWAPSWGRDGYSPAPRALRELDHRRYRGGVPAPRRRRGPVLRRRRAARHPGGSAPRAGYATRCRSPGSVSAPPAPRGACPDGGGQLELVAVGVTGEGVISRRHDPARGGRRLGSPPGGRPTAGGRRRRPPRGLPQGFWGQARGWRDGGRQGRWKAFQGAFGTVPSKSLRPVFTPCLCTS